MPQPCSKPLTPNPFETYRDPVTGQWKIKYPAAAQAAKVAAAARATVAEDDRAVRLSLGEAAPRRRWQEPARTTRTKVA